jgi:polar amino acid transport system permease protein
VTKRRRQQLVRGALYVLLLGGLALAVDAADWERLLFYFGDLEVARGMFPEAITIAMRNTILYTASAFVFGFALGLVLALMKISTIPPYRWLATIYIEIFRGLPALLTIYAVAFIVPLAFGIRWNDLQKITVGLGLVAAAYLAETLRAGIEGVPKGQMEAARSLGMSHGWAMTSIIVPQGFRLVIPPLTNELVLLIKDTALVFVIGVTLTSKELTKFGTDIARTEPTALWVTGLLYLALTVPLTQLVRVLERRNARAR